MPMTSLFESWNWEVLCKNVSLIDAGPSVEEQTILFKEAQDHHFDYGGPRSYEEKAFIQNGITRSERLDFRPMTSRFESWNGEVLCKNVSLIDAGPSVEEQTILFMEAQDRPSVEEHTILFMEAQDRPSVEEQTILFKEAQDRPNVEERAILFMVAQFEDWNEEVLCKNVSLIDAGPSVEEHTILFMEAQDRPSVEERAILFMEAQDRVKKKPLFKMRNSSSETPFQAHDQPIISLERGSIVLKCATY
ncbi:hypothetical protein Tco_0351132 [Tanacetum coccineum]